MGDCQRYRTDATVAGDRTYKMVYKSSNSDKSVKIKAIGNWGSEFQIQLSYYRLKSEI